MVELNLFQVLKSALGKKAIDICNALWYYTENSDRSFILPSSPNYVRKYAQERKTSLARGEGVKNASRKSAKRTYEAKYGKCWGDVDHRDGNALNNNPTNLRCIAPSKNRSYPRTKTGAKRK
jgi:hypothetical protein